MYFSSVDIVLIMSVVKKDVRLSYDCIYNLYSFCAFLSNNSSFLNYRLPVNIYG